MQDTINALKKKSNWVRKQVLETIMSAKRGHIGGIYSAVDILVALYYGGILKFDTRNPKWEGRDRLVVGKGHVCLALYHIWADLGLLDAKRVQEFGKDGSSLGGQLNLDTPGVEYNTGSLGNALGISAGMALAAKMDNKDYRCFALIGDGECQEGAIWESAVFSSKHRLSNLICIVDRNRLGVMSPVEIDDGSGKLEDKFESCNWEVKLTNGHDFRELLATFNNLSGSAQPKLVIADTVKGKGVSFMENGLKWHYSVPSEEEAELAREELNREVEN